MVTEGAPAPAAYARIVTADTRRGGEPVRCAPGLVDDAVPRSDRRGVPGTPRDGVRTGRCDPTGG